MAKRNTVAKILRRTKIIFVAMMMKLMVLISGSMTVAQRG